MITDSSSYTCKPTIKRLLFTFAGLPIGAYLLGFSLRLLVDYLSNDVGDLARQASFTLTWILTIVILESVIVLLNRDHFFVTITSSTISGPSTDGILGDTTFPLDQLDINSINRITVWDKLWLRRKILSKDKGKIMISRFYYSKAQEDEIIETLLSMVHQD